MEKKAQTRSANISAASSSGPGNKSRDPSTHPWRYKGNVKGGLFKDIKSLPFDPKVDVPHGVCFNCWQYGHSRQKCTEPDRRDHCHNCGRIGVRVNTCPRCSEAYLDYWKSKNPSNPKLQSLKLELAKHRKTQEWNKKDDRVLCLHFTDVEPIPFDPELDIPFKACGNCWKPIHAGLCDLRHHDHCFNCGRIGVHMGACPRCALAYPRYCERKIKDGIDPPLSVVGKKPKEPETTKTSSKPSAFKTFSPWAAKSFSAVLKDKDEGYFSQNGSVSNESPTSRGDNLFSQNMSISNESPSIRGDNLFSQNMSISIESPAIKVDNSYSQNASVSNGSTAVKVNNSMFKFTLDYVKDFQALLENIKHLSVTNQNTIVLQFLADRRKFIEQIKCERKKV